MLSALSGLKNKHLATRDLYSLMCSESSQIGFSSFTQSLVGVRTAYSPINRFGALSLTCTDDAHIDWARALQLLRVS